MDTHVITLSDKDSCKGINSFVKDQISHGDTLLSLFMGEIPNKKDTRYLCVEARKYISDDISISDTEILKLVTNMDQSLRDKMIASFSDVFLLIESFQELYCQKIPPDEYKRNSGLVIATYNGLRAGCVTITYTKGICYMIGIQQYVPYFVANMVLKSRGLIGLPRVSDSLVNAVEKFCVTRRATHIVVNPLDKMREILTQHYGFQEDTNIYPNPIWIKVNPGITQVTKKLILPTKSRFTVAFHKS